jgi:sortase A
LRVLTDELARLRATVEATDPGAPDQRPSSPAPLRPLSPTAPARTRPAPSEQAAGRDPADHRRRRAGSLGIGLLVGAGTLLVGDALATTLWQEPLSAAFSAREQAALDDDLEKLSGRLGRLAPASSPRQPAARRAGQLAATLRATADPGEALGRLSIPRLGGSWVVVQGAGSRQLRKGPGHYSSTALPGAQGTTAIAGHRTTFGAPFRRLDELKAGDRIVVRMPYGRFSYRVEGRRIVRPSHVAVLRDIGRPRLVLTACHPRYSARQRIVVTARQTGWSAAGPATRKD